MLAFRKYFLALAVVMLTVAVASAQGPAFQCVANAGVPPIVRAEGIAELVGDLVLNCNGGIPTAAGGALPQVNVQIFLNTNITSKIDSNGYSEALLMIDEPNAADQQVCVAGSVCVVAPTWWTAGASTPVNPYKPYTSPVSGATVRPYNIFQGRQSTGADNSLVWLGVPIDPPGTTYTRVIRITNVRANANQLGVSSTLVPTQIVAFISATGTTSVPINNPQQTVAWIQQGMTFSVRNNADDGGAPTLNQCSSTNGDMFSSASTTNGCPTFRLRYAEGFASAFKTRYTDGPLTGSAQNNPGQIYNVSESGFFATSGAGWPAGLLHSIGGAAGTTGAATQGTRLRAVFNNVPAGVRIFVTLTNYPAATGNTARLVNVAADGSGGYVPTDQYGTVNCSWILGTTGLAEVPIFGGSGTAVWEVTNTDPLAVQTMDFGVEVAYKANTSNNLPGIGTATVNGMFAPVSTTVKASTIAPVPRFADTSSAKSAVAIAQCVSNLLFPFVSQQGNFDTGLVIVNTSKDLWGHATEAGTCTVYYYGDTNGGAAPPAQTSAVIPAGDYMTWTLYGGGKFGMTATQGFQGYVMAQCKFRFAHGYAFISNLGDIKWAQGYIALVMGSPSYRSDVGSGESLGN